MRSYYAQLFETLRGEGYTALIAENGELALDILRREPVDLVLLDWNLPGISGESLLRALRASPRTRSLGILMVTGKCTLADELQALESGADDHLAKPFDEKILLARLRGLCRRQELALERRREISCPGLEFDLDADAVRVDGREIHLTPKEMDLLGIFLHQSNLLHAHDFLWKAVWGYESANWEHLLIVTLSSLRRKLGPAWGSRLKCHKGKGYVYESPH